MLLQILVALACLAAGIFQIGAAFSPDSSHLRILRVARRITGVFLLLTAAYIAWSIQTFGEANVVMCFLMGGLALGQVLFTVHTNYEPEQTERLMSRTPPHKGYPDGTHA